MQLPYIDDRRMVLYGKVTALFKFGKSILYGSHQKYHMLCLFVLFFKHFFVSPFRHLAVI